MKNKISTQSLYLDETERKRHESAISQLCEELSIRRSAMEGIYEEILLELKSKAHIQDFLYIFVDRTIRTRYRQSNNAVHRRPLRPLSIKQSE